MDETSYQLPIRETIAGAWERVYGSKKPFWGALLIAIIVGLILNILNTVIQYYSPIAGFFVNIIVIFVNLLLQSGVLYLGIQRAFDFPIQYKQMFITFESDMALRLVGVYLLQILIFFIPSFIFFYIPLIFHAIFTSTTHTLLISYLINVIFALSFLIGFCIIVYLAVRMSLSFAFVLDQRLGPVKAIKHSFRATRKNFWRLIAIMLFSILVFALSVLTLGIAFIWTLPFGLILFGVMYRNLLVNVKEAGINTPTI